MIIDNSLQTELVYKYRKAEKRIVLLDYDGTLVEYKPKPEQAIPSDALLLILKELAEEKDTEVIIITGRDHQEIEGLLGILPIDIIAGHGAMKRENGAWIKMASEDVKWKAAIRPILEEMSLKCSESFIEDKHFSMAWHYRNAGQNSGFAFSRELIRKVDNLLEPFDLKLLDGNKVIEIMHKGIGKGIAVKHLLAEKEFNFILSIGDDVTDEEIFALFLPDENAVTIKVGTGKSLARYSFISVSDVVLFLKHLSE
ncbi:MAG: trehalose-phosphatase [Bacteroidales bacterium]|nr:trehalose-phosphatase [Bacteroidales bacterium]